MNQKFWMLHFALGFLWQSSWRELDDETDFCEKWHSFGAMVMARLLSLWALHRNFVVKSC